MMRVVTWMLVSVLAVGVLAAAQASDTDAEWLDALDRARFFEADVTVLRVRILSVTPDEERSAEIRLLFSELDGETVSRIEFLAPEELAGQVFLNTPSGAFFYGPDLDFPIRTSATTEVFGDAAVAQTSGIRFVDDYTISERRTIEKEDGGTLIEMDLAAVDYSVAFQAITVTADPVTLRPISAILYALSGLPFYEVFYETYETRADSDIYVVRQRIVNLFLVGRQTTSEILEISSDPLAAELFDPDQLGAAP